MALHYGPLTLEYDVLRRHGVLKGRVLTGNFSCPSWKEVEQHVASLQKKSGTRGKHVYKNFRVFDKDGKLIQRGF